VYMLWWCKALRQSNKLSLETRSMVLVVMGLIVTTTYQTTLSPLGGLWQDNHGNATTNSGNSPPPPPHTAGTAIMGQPYFNLLLLNSACFLTSLVVSVVLLPALLCPIFLPLIIYFIMTYVISLLIISPSKLSP
jgi:hypothetical protein